MNMNKWDKYAASAPIAGKWDKYVAPSKPKAEPKQSFLDWATKPLVSKEKVLGSPIGQVMAGSSPITQIGGAIIPPPISQFIPPQIRQRQTAELISSETSPLSIASNALLGVGLLGKAGKLPSRFTPQKLEAMAKLVKSGAGEATEGAGKFYGKFYDKYNVPLQVGKETAKEFIDAIPSRGKDILNKIFKNDVAWQSGEYTTKHLGEAIRVMFHELPNNAFGAAKQGTGLISKMDIYSGLKRLVMENLPNMGKAELTQMDELFKPIYRQAAFLRKKTTTPEGLLKTGVLEEQFGGIRVNPDTKRILGNLAKISPDAAQAFKDYMKFHGRQVTKKLAAPLGGLGLIGYTVHRAIANKILKER